MARQSARRSQDLDDLRDALIQSRTMNEPVRHPELEGGLLSDGGDEMDLARCQIEAQTHAILSEHRRMSLVAIDVALERIRDGSYGRCESCDEEISVERLRALPFATFCIDCQQAREDSRAAVAMRA
jgi:RNA polymerase-binding protein DksA